MEVTIETATEQDFCGIITVGGTLQTSPTDIRTIVAPSAGEVVMKKEIVSGSTIRAGSSLISINTKVLAQSSTAERNSLALAAAKREKERCERLIKENLITLNEYNVALSVYEQAFAEYSASIAKGKNLVTVCAPIDGFVTSCNVKAGDFVEAGQTLATISSSNNLILLAEIPEREFAHIDDITGAYFQPSYDKNIYDIDSLGGKIVARDLSTQNNGGFLNITFLFENRAGLVAGTYSQVWLKMRNHHNAVTVPLTALVREGDEYYIFVKDDATCFDKKMVKCGENNGTRIEIKSGLKAGEQFAATGAQQIALAGIANAIPVHSHNH